jgi:hypothetical protein
MRYLLLILMVILSQLVQAQAPQPGMPPTKNPFVMLRLNQSVDALMNKTDLVKTDTDAKALSAKIHDDVLFITQIWLGSKTPYSPGYELSISYDIALLNDAVKPDTKAADAKAMLADVAADLDVKVAFARKSNGIAESADGMIQVSVTTKKDGQPVNGYLVRCNPKRYADRTTPMFPFSKMSSPTISRVPPGNYVFYAENANHERVGEVPITIGLQGKPSEEVDLPVK